MPKQKYKVSGAELAREIGQSEGTVSRKRGQGLTDDEIRQEANERAAVEKTFEANKENVRDAKTRKETALADLAELQVAEKKSELIPYADVNKWVSTNIIRARDILLRISPELRDRLAAETDPVKCGELIDAEVYRALAELKTVPR
jgi:hypothetical protein